MTEGLFYIIGHIKEVKNIAFWQWCSVAGAAMTAFSGAVLATHKYDDAALAAVGVVIVAVVHILQPNPAQQVGDKK